MKTLLSPFVQICPGRYSQAAYCSLLLMATTLLVLNNWQYGFCMLGISLVAIPGGNKVKFSERPVWQRMWIRLHFVVLAGAMLYLILSKI